MLLSSGLRILFDDLSFSFFQELVDQKMVAIMKERDEAMAKLRILESKLQDANIQNGWFGSSLM